MSSWSHETPRTMPSASTHAVGACIVCLSGTCRRMLVSWRGHVASFCLHGWFRLISVWSRWPIYRNKHIVSTGLLDIYARFSVCCRCAQGFDLHKGWRFNVMVLYCHVLHEMAGNESLSFWDTVCGRERVMAVKWFTDTFIDAFLFVHSSSFAMWLV